jgi:hypothetical protein
MQVFSMQTQLQKASTSFVKPIYMSACISVIPTGWISAIFDVRGILKNITKLQIWLKSGKNIKHLT